MGEIANAGPSKAESRRLFAAGRASDLAATVCPGALPWRAAMPLSRLFGWFRTDDQLVVVGHPGESQRDLDLGLAFGIAHAGDSELVLVLPAGTDEATRRRLPWLDIPVAVWTFDATGDLTSSPPLTRHEVLTACDDPLVTAIHNLGDRVSWVARLVAWADTSPELVPAHRSSYLAWHCRGRMVLKVRRGGQGLVASAGVHSTIHRPQEVTLNGELSAEQFHRLIAAASAATADRLGGQDVGNAEHQLQERLAEIRSKLGLTATLREFPATRPVENRGFIDLLGVGRDGAIHVVETKIGADTMLVLQGLDYWTWATAHRTELIGHLAETLGVPLPPSTRVVLDFVIAPKDGVLISPYTAAQLEALDGSLPWHVHRIDGWDTEETTITSHGRRRVPDDYPRASEGRFAVRSEAALIEGAGQALTRRVFFADPGGGILEPAKASFDLLQEQGLLHGYVDHVRSSQAFALNLFGGLDAAETHAVWALIEPLVTTPETIEFEFVDPLDALAESQASRPHQTQVDVLLRGSGADGTRHAALIEVKLSETRFGHCSAFDAPGNDRRDVCNSPGPWGGDTAACYQLRNHDGPARRRYDAYLEPAAVNGGGRPHCVFRDLNQPMRNMALARVLIERDEVDAVTFALCAPSANSHVWRQWSRAIDVFADVPGVSLRGLPAEAVVRVLGPARREAIHSRYGIPAD